MKIKRVLCMATAAAIGASLAGCGGKTNVAESDVTTITVWTTDSHSKTTIERLVDDFNENEGKAEGIKIDYQVIEGNAFKKSLELALQTGQGPDLIPPALGIETMVDKGYIAALDDLPGSADFIAKYKDQLVNKRHTYNGKIYAVPRIVTTRGLIYNKDMFKEAGIVDENGEPTPPETFDEMREYAKKLTDKSSNKFGVIFPMKWDGWVGSDIISMLQSSVGHREWDFANKRFDCSGLAPIINSYMGMIDDGSAYPGSEGIDNDTARAYFAEGLIGMKIAYSFDVGVLNDQFPAKCDWGVAPLPVIDKDNRYMQIETTQSSFFVNAASVDTKGGDKLMKCVEWFSSDDFMTTMYKEGLAIPADYELIKDIEPDSGKKGWKEFAGMQQISNASKPHPSVDMTGYALLSDRIKNDVLSGNVSAEDMLRQYDEDAMKAAEKYYEQHTEESLDDYADPTWDLRR